MAVIFAATATLLAYDYCGHASAENAVMASESNIALETDDLRCVRGNVAIAWERSDESLQA